MSRPAINTAQNMLPEHTGQTSSEDGHAPGALIELRDLTKKYPVRGGNEVVALDRVNLSVERGSIHGIVGQSGAGKSTLIRCLTALESPTEGSVTLGGVELTKLGHAQLREERRSIGMVFQSANLLDARTALANVEYPMKVAGTPKQERRERAQKLLELVGLGNRGTSYPAQLSGGQRQRVGIARALAAKPKVVLCDEPTSALDAESTRQVLDLLAQIRDEMGVTIIIITHEMGVVRAICDSATLLEHGKIVESGSIESIVANPSSRLAQELVPMPSLTEEAVAQDLTIIDTMFTSTPGVPTGSTVMSLASRMGADVLAGTFESFSNVQVGRLALGVPQYHADRIIETLKNNQVYAEVRA